MNIPPQIPPPIAPPVQEAQPVRKYVPLEKIPYPPYVLVLAAITALAFLAGLVRLPGTIRSGIDYENATHLIEINQPQRAVVLLKPLVARYPDSKDIRADLAMAYALNGQLKEGATELDYFEGKEVDRKLNQKLDQIGQIIESKLPSEKLQGGEKP